MTRDAAISEFMVAAKTPFKVLAPAKIVARTMSLIGGLRHVHAQDWSDIAGIFNAAMAEVAGKEVTAATLCRLHNLELKRLILIYADQREHSTIFEPTSDQGRARAFAVNAPASTGTVSLSTSQNNARDGPAGPSTPEGATPMMASAQESLRIMQEITSFRKQTKKNR